MLAVVRVGRPRTAPAQWSCGRLVVSAVRKSSTQPDATLPTRQGRDLRRVVTIGRKKFMFNRSKLDCVRLV